MGAPVLDPSQKLVSDLRDVLLQDRTDQGAGLDAALFCLACETLLYVLSDLHNQVEL